MSAVSRSLGSRDALVALALLVLIAVLAAVAIRFHGTPTAVLTGNLIAREQYWSERIRVVGATRAYMELAGAIAPLSPTLQHENAHAFGGALFDINGLSGLSTCDARFSFGCYHEFLGRAIARQGLGVVNELNQECVEALGPTALSCQHGIGHGIEAYLGYDIGELVQALTTCKSLPFNDSIGGCYGGVFMEYNMRTMLGDAAHTRPVHAGDPHYPCDTIAADYLPACVFWSPQWWLTIEHQEGDFAAVGRLCDALGSRELVRDCYEGLGTVAPPEARFDTEKIAALCEQASPDPLHELYCKSYAANALTVGGAGQVGNGAAVCAGLTGQYLHYCNAYARNRANIATERPSLE